MLQPLWKLDASPKQIEDSLALKETIKENVLAGNCNSVSNTEFQQEVSEHHTLIREDRLELYHFFRNYLLDLKKS